MKDRTYFLGFSAFPGIGPIKFEKLLKKFGSAKNAWTGTGEELEPIIGKTLFPKFDKFRSEFDLGKYEKELAGKKISYITLSDKAYPPLLKQIPNPPIILYIKGNTALIHPEKLENLRMIAIVGTRKITNYGRDVTELFSSSLAQSGIIIVSGLAIGVDAKAHISCLEVEGKTIAVLGNGVDLPFPSNNKGLYDRILKSGGAIISEFPPGEPPSKGSFPSRNRIIAGLSDGVLVTEGAKDSGSLITANYGLEFGRKVFAVPGPITSSLSAAPLRLIEKGAKLVVSPEDVLRELKVKSAKLKVDGKKFASLSLEEKKIVKLLENENLHFDEIVRRLKLDSSKLATILSMMEIKGFIKNSGGSYSIIQ